jgi:hypothetical protein
MQIKPGFGFQKMGFQNPLLKMDEFRQPLPSIRVEHGIVTIKKGERELVYDFNN